jgi:hypothetical protein
MKRALVLALSVGLVLPTVAAAGKHHRRHVRTPWICRPGHPNLVAANTRAEVFEAFYEPSAEPRFGCAYGQRRPVVLGQAEYGSSSGAGGSGDYTLAGTTVAFTETFCSGALGPGPGGCSEYLKVVKLRKGAVLHQGSVMNAGCRARVLQLVLKEDGAVAWLAENSYGGASEEMACPARSGAREVHALDSSGEHVLAAGTNIDPSSIALAGSTVYWMQGGQPHDGPLN